VGYAKPRSGLGPMLKTPVRDTLFYGDNLGRLEDARRGRIKGRASQLEFESARAEGVVPVGTMGKAISFRVPSPRAEAGKAVKQIGTFCS
jgi:hypothetical protein